MKQADVVIVGAGHGGAAAASSLRQQGFDGSVLMIGREPELPYERPPLSKEYLARDKSFERLLIRPASYWAERNIELILRREVTAVDPLAKTVTLSDGTTIRYGCLIWSAGGDPRHLPCGGADLQGVHEVRTRSDVDTLMAELDAGARRAVVVGGGYIGLEAAAVLSKLGCSVVLLESQSRLLARVAGVPLSDYYRNKHEEHHVEVRTDIAVDRLEGVEGRVSGVRLLSGNVIPADVVIVGIGIAPCVGPLLAAGASGGNGVEVDEYCRTSLPQVYAIGDCAAHPNPHADGAVIRLESVQNAADMAVTAAKAICGAPAPYAATPWFWSNQYDLKLQTIGLSASHDHAVVRGDPAENSFSVVYLKDGRVVALDCVNRPKDYVQGRKLVEARTEVTPEMVCDVSIPLKDFVALA